MPRRYLAFTPPTYGGLWSLSRHGKGGHSRCSAPPLPRAQWPISKIDRNVIPFCKPHIKRCVATVFEKWNCLIENYLCARRKNLPRKIAPLWVSRRGSLLEYGGLKPILPFSEGRSDAACRVVISPSRLPPMGIYGFYNAATSRVVILLFAVPVDAHVGAKDGRCRMRRNALPAMPTVGAGSSQREDSPAHCLHMRIPCHTWRWAVFTTTRRAASLSSLHASHLWESTVFTTMRRA